MLNLPPKIASRLRRANRHIEETATLVRNYLSSEPIVLGKKVSDCGEWDVIYIERIHDYDAEIACAIGDALYNLRSSLDHIMMQVVRKHCDVNQDDLQKVYFPIKKSEDEFKKWAKSDAIAKQLPAKFLSTLDEGVRNFV